MSTVVRQIRYAVVSLARSRDEVEAYLPENYRVVADHLAEPVHPGGRRNVIIEGTDDRGWTLDDYVIPRLASGNLYAKEYPTYHDAADSACSAMN